MRVVHVTRFGGPEVLAVAEAPDPRTDPGQVLVDVSAIEVLFLDTQLRSGWGQDYFPFQPPYVPGTGVAGVVSAVGDGVDSGWIGRTVVARTGDSGAYAERVAVPVQDAFEVPIGVDGVAALAALHDGPTALSRIEKSDIERGEWVLVTAAAGSLGSWFMPLARAAGARVVAAARGETKLQRARELGADLVVDYSEQGWTGQVRETIGDRGVDVVFDGAGGTIGRDAFDITAAGGRFFAYGAASGDFAGIDPQTANRRRISVIGVGDQLDLADWIRLTERALTDLAAGRVTSVVGQVVPFERAADAHAAIEARTVAGKTVLTTAGS